MGGQRTGPSQCPVACDPASMDGWVCAGAGMPCSHRDVWGPTWASLQRCSLQRCSASLRRLDRSLLMCA